MLRWTTLTDYRLLPEGKEYSLKLTGDPIYERLVRDGLEALEVATESSAPMRLALPLGENEPEIRAFLERLRRHPFLHDELDESFCLHARPQPAVSRMAENLAGLIGGFVCDHPAYFRADAVVSVPPRGSKSDGGANDLAEHIAGLFAARLVEGLDVIDASALVAESIPSEDEPDGEQSDFWIRGDVTGLTILILDVFYGSGARLNLLGDRFRGAGADAVLGLVAYGPG